METAISCYDRALSLDPNCSVAHFNHGLATVQTWRFATAWASLEKAWNLGHPKALKLMGRFRPASEGTEATLTISFVKKWWILLRLFFASAQP